VTIGVRPENWRLVSEGEGGLPVEVVVVEELGADGYVYGTTEVAGKPHDIIVRVSARQNVHKGDVLHVTTDPAHVHVFDTQTGERLSD
jgi:multiple sugar transport system ATP-binding protein